MSPLGPSATTRLVLSAHVLFMDRDGSNCRVGVRRLAAVTGLNKDTVATHRGLAIQAGWLIASGRSTSPNREVLAAVPDGIAVDQVDQLSREAGQLLSGPVSQSKAQSISRPSDLRDAAVRSHPPSYPVGSDVPLQPLSPLGNRSANTTPAATDEKIGGGHPESPQARLRIWMLSNETAQKYQHDPEALTRLAPLDCRYPGYESFVRRLSDRIRNGG